MDETDFWTSYFWDIFWGIYWGALLVDFFAIIHGLSGLTDQLGPRTPHPFWRGTVEERDEGQSY